MKHALGGLGVLAAGVLLAVSAAMNWQFGYSLGRTEFDGYILGAASAAADCFKALVPFFFFAAIKNRAWSQAVASAVLWVVVTGYSLTSALGGAHGNRQDVASKRNVEQTSYKDVRADLERARSQLSWIPQHRPEATVRGELDGMKNRREWTWSNGCTDVKSKTNREFCDKYHATMSEAASAQQAAVWEKTIAELQAKLSKSGSSTAMSAADPQIAALERLTGLNPEVLQTSLSVLLALLLEIGSGFGMYVSFSVWRLYDQKAPVAPSMAALQTVSQVQPAAVTTTKAPRIGANDNRTAPRLTAPETDVERYHKERQHHCNCLVRRLLRLV
jgi:hypothetical protein